MATSPKRRSMDSPLTRRIKATKTDALPFQVTNVNDGEVIHQNCLLISGSGPLLGSSSETDYVLVKVKDEMQTGVNTTTWPLGSTWTALVCLKPGKNHLTFELHQARQMMDIIKISLVYQPLLQIPPVHLAILVAKDSPLTIDCPSSKFGNVSNAHSGIKGAISKLRTTACMWQALIAEELRLRGVGRRAFRLEEEWARGGQSQIRVHVIPSERTVEELQSQPSQMEKHFMVALKKYSGSHFASTDRPIIAGLVLDAQYSVSRKSVRGAVRSGKHHPDGISLAMLSSEMVHSWPRNIAEVAECLADNTHLGDLVCTSPWSICQKSHTACAFSQGFFLHELVKSMGIEMNYTHGTEHNWIARFIASGHGDAQTEREIFTLATALNLKSLPQFRIPGDEPLSQAFREATIDFKADTDDNDEDVLRITSHGCPLAKVVVTNGSHSKTFDLLHQVRESVTLNLSSSELIPFSREEPLHIYALAMNGKEKTCASAWRLTESKAYIVLPATAISPRIKLLKRGTEHHNEPSGKIEHHRGKTVPWMMFFHKLDTKTNTLVPATRLELRIGACFDGAYVTYHDGSHVNCGPEYHNGSRFTFGGGGYAQDIKPGDYITKVSVSGHPGNRHGIEITLSTGNVVAATRMYGKPENVIDLAPGPGERVVGFYGTSNRPGYGYVCDFGIIVAKVSDLSNKGRLPLAAYRLDCVKNSGRYEGDGGPEEEEPSSTENENRSVVYAGPEEGPVCNHRECIEYYLQEESWDHCEEDSEEDSIMDCAEEDAASEHTVE